jgi:hypothetical protein
VVGLLPALTAVTAITVADNENCLASVPASLYLSSLPVTLAAHVNPRTPVSAPSLRVTVSPALGVIPTELSVFLSSVPIEVVKLTATLE